MTEKVALANKLYGILVKGDVDVDTFECIEDEAKKL